MAEHFLDQFVKWAYRVETRTQQTPSEQNLVDFDNTLDRRFGAHLETAMRDAGIKINRRNKSIIAMLALSSSGSRRSQVERACAYWSHVESLVL